MLEFFFPEGVTHIQDHLECYVYTCWDAAINRNIHLESELKSLILKIDEKFYLYHGTGNRTVSFEKLKRYGSKIKILPSNQLTSLSLGKGIINPFNTRHVNFQKIFICSSVLTLNEIYTNDGTANGTIKFDPELLLYTHTEIVVEYFSNENNTVFDAPISYKHLSKKYRYSFKQLQLLLISHKHVFIPSKYAEFFLDALKCEEMADKNVCDMCTGSGVLGIFVALNGAKVTAIDINPYSVMASHFNAKNNGVTIEAINSNCFSSLKKYYYGYFDIIICNPPTIPDWSLPKKLDAITWNNNGDGRLVLDKMILQSKKYRTYSDPLTTGSLGTGNPARL